MTTSTPLHLDTGSEVSDDMERVDEDPRSYGAQFTERLGALLKEHLSFSLEKVFRARDQQGILTNQGWIVPDLWIATISRNPTSTRRVVEPGVIIEIEPSASRTECFFNRLRAYRVVEGLRELIVVVPHTRALEIYRRTDTTWESFDLEDASHLCIASIGTDIPLQDLWPSREPEITDASRECPSRTGYRPKRVA